MRASSSPTRVEFSIPGKLVSGNETIVMASRQARFNHAKIAAGQRRDVALLLMSARHKPPLPIVVTITRRGPMALDAHDNLSFSGKHVADEIAKWYKIEDKRSEFVWEYSQEKSKRYSIGVVIRAICGKPIKCKCCLGEGRCLRSPSHSGGCKLAQLDA